MLFIAHAILVVGQCPQPVPAHYASVKPGKIVAAYFGSWDKYGEYKVADIEPVAKDLTHIIYAFAKPNPDSGACELHDPWADVGANFEHRKKFGGHFSQLQQLKLKFPHLKILLSVGGGGSYSRNLLEIAKQGLTRRFVKSVTALLDYYEYDYEHSRHGSVHAHKFEYPELFDGVDLDWEWPTSMLSDDHVSMYHKVLEGLSEEMKKRTKRSGRKSLLTCAIQVHPKLISSLQLGNAAKYVDWFHVMAYDYGGSNGSGVSFNAPICNQWSDYSIDSSINLLMKSGVSPAKMVLGIPLYGQVYDKAEEKVGSSFAKTEKTGALQYRQIKERYLENPDCLKKWHAKSMAAYAYCAIDEIFVSYDDERSVALKVAYARKKLLQGIVFWRLSGDDKDHSLVKAARKKK